MCPRVILLVYAALLAVVPPCASAQQFRIGILKHDTSFLAVRREHGTDINLEWLGSPIALPAAIDSYFDARPFIGYSGHMSGHNTDEIYGGGAFEILPGSTYDFTIGLGLSVHDGKLHAKHEDRSALGQRVLFYASFEFGRWWGRHGLFVFYQHASNGPLPGPNDGINNIGVRYGFRP